MTPKSLLRDMAITIPVTFVVAAIVTYLYSLLFHGAGTVDWEAAFDLAFIVGIVVPLALAMSGKNKSSGEAAAAGPRS